MHCTTGNNRTGVFVAILLFFLGVPQSEVVKEYALSEQGLAPTRHLNVERLMKKGAFADYGAEEARRKCERMVGAREESMEALLEAVKTGQDGVEGYFREVLGFGEGELEALRKLFTAEGEAICE
jgi:hypothetical protein